MSNVIKISAQKLFMKTNCKQHFSCIDESAWTHPIKQIVPDTSIFAPTLASYDQQIVAKALTWGRQGNGIRQGIPCQIGLLQLA